MYGSPVLSLRKRSSSEANKLSFPATTQRAGLDALCSLATKTTGKFVGIDLLDQARTGGNTSGLTGFPATTQRAGLDALCSSATKTTGKFIGIDLLYQTRTDNNTSTTCGLTGLDIVMYDSRQGSSLSKAWAMMEIAQFRLQLEEEKKKKTAVSSAPTVTEIETPRYLLTDDQLRTYFEKLDVDKSGTIDLHEMQAAYSKFDRAAFDDPAESVRKCVNKNNLAANGRFTFDEFALIMLYLSKTA
eukprot:NODE_830_length_1301_cov_222.415335_g629_i0.p1 GENE.NODE_830_length_1301_cov_222.415335_g629_i0~~NODE_830_length_1301_cov_222.415335_g629_i0.p1  ORF type:complete len:244 (-),score=49.29 NODE_830_length_1301_cov_222.415335_g629_i0:399-1130(-)